MEDTQGKGLDKLMKASPELQAIVGQEMISRKMAIKGIWDYIKSNNLQDPEDKRTIVPDEKLKKVFGGEDRVNMMSIAKHLSNNLSSVDAAADDSMPMAA